MLELFCDFSIGHTLYRERIECAPGSTNSLTLHNPQFLDLAETAFSELVYCALVGYVQGKWHVVFLVATNPSNSMKKLI